jgi:threonine/homoserine/homoserine lactone efflux protein
MVDLYQLTLYAAAAVLLAITPGPGIFYVAARTLAGGRAEGIASSFGTGLGGMVHVVAGSLGVSGIVLASAQMCTVLKVLGAVYLIWMGVRTILLARQDAMAASLNDASASTIGPRRAFREGAFVEALNPKTAIFFLAFIPQFIDPAGHVAVQFIILGSISVLLNTLADIAVAFAAGDIRQGATSRPNLIRRLREGSGVALVALGVGLALAKRPA